MIVWLEVPETEAKAAMRKGAQRSLETGRWFVKDCTNLAPFMRWIPARVTAPTTATVAKPEPDAAWLDPRETKKGRKGRRMVRDATAPGAVEHNLPTLTGRVSAMLKTSKNF